MRTCNNCGWTNRETEAFCTECLSDLDITAARPPESGSTASGGCANLAAFGRAVLERSKARVAECGGGEEDEENMQLAFKLGLVERVIYDPDKHGEVNSDCEPGDEIWWWGSGRDSHNKAQVLRAGSGAYEHSEDSSV